MSDFRFADPLWFLAAIPVLLALLFEHRRESRRAVVFSSLVDLKGLPVTLAQRVKRLLPALRALALLLLIAALARPQHGRSEFRVRTEGIAIMMTVDRSGSMAALDFTEGREEVNRLQVVKKVFKDFVTGGGKLKGRPDDVIGLVAFGGFAESRCPLTLDHGALLSVLDTVRIPGEDLDVETFRKLADFIREESATAIGDAIARAVDGLKDCKLKSRIIILLSDGGNTAGVIESSVAADLAHEAGIRIYTIGVGGTGDARFKTLDAFGRTQYVRQFVRLDEDTLKDIAARTDGAYFNAQDTASLEDVYAQIDRLEKTEAEGQVFTEYDDLFPSLLWSGLALLALDLVLRATRFRSLP